MCDICKARTKILTLVGQEIEKGLSPSDAFNALLQSTARFTAIGIVAGDIEQGAVLTGFSYVLGELVAEERAKGASEAPGPIGGGLH